MFFALLAISFSKCHVEPPQEDRVKLPTEGDEFFNVLFNYILLLDLNNVDIVQMRASDVERLENSAIILGDGHQIWARTDAIDYVFINGNDFLEEI